MPRPASDIRQRLVHAARARFLHEGVDGASLRSVAQDARTNIGMVYYYFKTKDDLFLAVVEEAYAKLLLDLSSDLATDVTPEQRLRRLYARMSRLDDDEIDVVRLVMREALVSSARLTRLAQRFEHGHVPLVLATLRDGVESGALDPSVHPAVQLVATFSLAVLPQVLHRLISTTALPVAQLLPSRADAAQQLADILLFGISSAKNRRKNESTGRREDGKSE